MKEIPHLEPDSWDIPTTVQWVATGQTLPKFCPTPAELSCIAVLKLTLYTNS
jgi:hypothetical protein